MSSIVNSQHDVDMTGLHLEQARPVDINKDENSFREKQVCMSFDDVCRYTRRDESCAKTQDGMLVFEIQYVLSCVLCSMSCVQYFSHLASLWLVCFVQPDLAWVVSSANVLARKCWRSSWVGFPLGFAGSFGLLCAGFQCAKTATLAACQFWNECAKTQGESTHSKWRASVSEGSM